MSSQASTNHARFTHLVTRRANKALILAQGGEQALSHSWKDVARIDHAIKRLEEGQYGLCCNCGIAIEIGRLDLIPETPFCAECAHDISN